MSTNSDRVMQNSRTVLFRGFLPCYRSSSPLYLYQPTGLTNYNFEKGFFILHDMLHAATGFSQCAELLLQALPNRKWPIT